MRRFQRYVVLVLLIASAQSYSGITQAQEYYWSFSGAQSQYGSAFEAANAYIQRAADSSTTYNNYRLGDTRFASATRFQFCYLADRVSNGVVQNFCWHEVNRSGTQCPTGTEYNAQTGGCEGAQPDQCESTIGDVVYHEFRFASLGSDGNPSADPPVTVCKSGCQYSHTFGDFSSKRDFGPPDQLVGSFEYKGNGISCTPSANDPSVFDQPPAKDPVTKAPEYASSNDCSAWETQPDGTLKRNCTANTSYKDEGQVECKGGTAGSGFSSSVTCTPSKNKPPQKSETNVEQETTKKDNPDGSSETTTKTDTTKTECKGTKPCESTSKTETESENTDANGNTTKNGNCVGDGCNPDKPDGDGVGDEEGEQGEERTATVGTCDGGFSCSGDPIDCAILKQQKEQQCYAEEMGDFDGKKADIEGLFQGDAFTLEEAEVSAPSIIGEATRFLPAGCPAPERAQLSGGSLSFSYQPLCTIAVDLSWIIVAVASIWAAAYVGRAFGGE